MLHPYRTMVRRVAEYVKMHDIAQEDMNEAVNQAMRLMSMYGTKAIIKTPNGLEYSPNFMVDLETLIKEYCPTTH